MQINVVSPRVWYKRRVQCHLQSLSQLWVKQQFVFIFKHTPVSDFKSLSVCRTKSLLPHTHTYLVLHGDLSSQCVVCVPLLVEAQAQLLHLVFGLQAP